MPLNKDSTRPVSDGRKYEAFEYWKTPRKERAFTEAQFRSMHRFNIGEWKRLKSEWLEVQQEIKAETGLRREYMKAHPFAGLPQEEVFEMPDDRVQAFKDKIYELAMQGKNSQYALLYARMEGLVEKDEKSGDTANILQVVIAALNDKSAGPGDSEVPGGPVVLRTELREGSIQGEDGDNPVPTLAPRS